MNEALGGGGVDELQVKRYLRLVQLHQGAKEPDRTSRALLQTPVDIECTTSSAAARRDI